MASKISLCMIVKNEEKFIRRSLASVVNIVDEMVVVDTGSSDKTVEFATEMGCAVFSYKWQDDFSAARNFAFKHATGDWALILDADEELEKPSGIKMREIIFQNSTINAYDALIVNVGLGTIFSSLRLVKNDGNVLYSRKMHEALISVSTEHPLITAPSGLKILHYGYTNDSDIMRSKRARNKKLLELQISDGADGTLDKYYLACMKADDKKDITGALRLFGEILSSEHFDLHIAVRSLSLYVELLEISGNHAEVVKAVQKFPNLMNYNPTIAFYYGIASIKLDQLDDAVNAFKYCINFDIFGTSYGLIRDDIKHLARENLIVALVRSKKIEEAGKIARDLLELDQQNPLANEILAIIKKQFK